MVRASIIVPAYNAAEFLSVCIESLIRQTEKSIEIIIVNDGSTDRTLYIAKSYAQRDSRIIVIDQPNRGVSAARNCGMASASGDYLAFIDSDDWAEPEMVEVMIKSCEVTQSEVAVAGAIFDYRDKNDRLVHSEVQRQKDWIAYQGEVFSEDVLSGNFLNLLGFPWNKIYQREWLARLGYKFDEGLQLYEDVDFNVRVLSKASQISFVSRSFVHYNLRPRASLLSARDLDFLTVSHRAIKNFDFFLERWGVDSLARKDREAKASAGALWMTLNGALAAPRPRDFLEQIVMSPQAAELIESAASARSNVWRYRWATLAVSRGWYRTGLAFVAVLRPISKYKAYIYKLLRR